MKIVYFLCLIVTASLINVTKGFLATPICGVDLCSPPSGSCVSLGTYFLYNTTSGIYYFPSDTSTKLEPDPYGIPTATCDGSSTCNAFCKSSSCSGTPAYCANNSCIEGSQCFCDIGTATTKSYISTPDGEKEIVNQMPYNLQWCQTSQRKRSLPPDISQNCTLYVVDNYPSISLHSSPDISGYIKATFSGDTRVLQFSNGAVFSIPDQWTHSTGYIFFELISSHSYCTGTYSVIARSTCTVSDCIMCSEFWANWQCIPSSYRTALVWLSVILIMIAICLLPWVGWVIYVVISLVWSLLYCCFSVSRNIRRTKGANKVSKFITSKVQGMRTYFDDDTEVEALEANRIDEVILTDDSSSVQPQPSQQQPRSGKFRGYSGGMPIYTFYFISLILCSQVVSSCTGGLSVSSTSNLCTMNGTNQVCNTVFNLVGSVSGIGDKFCFTLKSPEGEIWTGSVQHIGVVATMPLNSQYFTSSWAGTAQSSHWCDGTAKCSGGCNGVCSNRLCNNALSNPSLNLYPGISQCHSSCGCVTCSNCFLCTPSCLYSGFAIIPSGPVYQVFSLGSITYTPSVWVSIQGPGVSINKQASLGQTSISVGNFTIQLNGAFQGPQLNFGSLSPICDSTGNTCYFTSSAAVNAITSGIPGDIQATTASALTTPGSNFRIGNVHSVVSGDLGDTYIFPNSGVSSTFSTWKSLPANIDGNIYTGNITNIKTNLTSPPAILFSMSTPSGLTYTRTQTVVCPSFTISNASGCYNCLSGSVVTITARSTCSGGVVTISSDITLVTNSLSLTTVDTVYLINIKPTSSPVRFSLTLSSQFSTATQTFTFSPVFVSDVVQQNSTVINGTSNTVEDLSSIQKFFNNLSSDIADFSKSTAGIITWVILGVSLIAIVLLIILVPRLKRKTQ